MTGQRPSQAERLTALEKGYDVLGQELHGLRSDFQDFAGEIRRQMQNAARPQWAAIIGGLSLVVTVLGGLVILGSAGPIEMLSRHDRRIESLRERQEAFQPHRFMDTDAAILEGRLTERIRRLEDNLEVHTEDGHPHRTEARVDSLERRVQTIESFTIQPETKR